MADARTLLVHPEDGVDRIAAALEAADCTVTTVHSATAAVGKIATGEFDCVVSEYDLPGDDGLTLVETVRESDVALPIVLFTESEEEVSEAALDSGVDRVLRKNGSASIDRLVTDVTTIGAAGSRSSPRQDVSGHEPTDEEVARAVSEAPIGLSLSDPELEDYPLVYINDAWTEWTGYEKSDVLGRNPRFLQGPETDPDTVERLGEAVANEEQITVEIRNYRKDGTPFWNELTVAPIYDDGELAHYVGFQNDVTDRKRAERLAEERAAKLTAEREALDRVLGRVNGLLSEISRILVEGTDAESISERVCAEIADEPGYLGGWIADAGPGTGTLEITASSGLSLESTTSVSIDETPEAVARAFETDEVQGCPAGSAPDARLSPEHFGAPRLVVVPLVYGQRRYGLLGVYSNDGNALDRRERKMCESVGKMIANGLHSVETTRILTTDQVVEICVTVDDRTFQLSRIADAIGASVEHLGTARMDDDGCELYLKTTAGEETLSKVSALPFVSEVRTVSASETELTFAVAATESPPFARLAQHGGVVAAATAEATRANLTIEAPPQTDVRSLLDVLRAEYDGIELRSRVERENRDRSLTEFAASVDDRLTDRQRSALKTAELNGYFEWPRPVDGSEIAETMGITRQTFHQHLRAAERKLVEAYVDP